MKKRFLAAVMAICTSLVFLTTAALAAEEVETDAAPEVYSDVTDIIGPDTGTGEIPNQGEVIQPDTDSFQSNDQFRPYDPGYPKKARYGNYTLRVPELKGRLTFSVDGKNQLVGTLFAPGLTKNGSFKDATKQWSNDSALCFAASSSNLISWYLEQYQQLHPTEQAPDITDPEQIFNRFRQGWPDEGGDQKEALSWYFTGGFPSGSDRPAHGKPVGKGGYLSGKIPHNTSENWSLLSHDWQPQEPFTVYGGHSDNQFPYIEEVSGHYGNGELSNLEKFSEQILRQLHYGACSISILKDSTTGGAGHAITLWGADYIVDSGLITGIYVTDSDDYGKGMFWVGIKRGNSDNDGVRLVSYPYHAMGDSSPFTKIRDSVLLYAPNVVMGNEGYDGPAAIIDTLIPDADGSGVRVQSTNIVGRTLEYGYSYDQNPDNVTGWQTSSYFSRLAPDQYYFFARVKGEDGQSAGGVSAPAAYRVKTPSPAAYTGVPALSLGTTAFQPYLQAGQYIWLGTERGMDGQGAEEPILWRVLDTTASDQRNGLFLLSDRAFGSGENGGIGFSNAPYRNDYQGSNVQQWCQDFGWNRFNDQEQSAILATTKSDQQYSNGITFGQQADILRYDDVFLPSAEEMMTLLDSAGRRGLYHGGYVDYWLRSPVAQTGDYVGYVNSTGDVGSISTLQDCAVRPAFNLNGDQVLYAAAVGNGQFTDRVGLEKIQTVQSADFRLVLRDDTRAFRVTTPELTGQSGGSVSLSYQGAVVGRTDNEYISVILMNPDGTPAYYGKVARVQTADGTVQFALPADLSDGVYTLKVCNEQYNGARESGVASKFCDVRLTISGEAEVRPITQVDLTVTAPVTGELPQTAAAGSGCAVVETLWTPEHDVFQPNTHYDVTITVKAEPNHEFLSSTVFRVNGHEVTPTVNGELYTVTYTAFPVTAGDTTPGGGDTTPGGGSSHSGGSSHGSSSTPEQAEVTHGPDGSRIETVTRPDGTKVETTTFPNGDKTVTETKKDGSVTTSTKKVDGTTAWTSTDKNGQIKGEVVISEKAEREAKEAGEPLELPIPPVYSGTDQYSAPTIQVKTESGQQAKVTIPVSPVTPSTVAVVVRADGTEEIVRKSVVSKTGVTLSVESGAVVKIVDNTKTFTDTAGHWAKDSIDFVTSHQLYSGTSATTFSPDAGMTRGMLAVVLHNLESNPDSTAAVAFGDVKGDAWCAEAIGWAAEKKIINGYSNGNFGPNDQINREQLAVMLYRYAHGFAYNDTVLDFRDVNEISPYAREAMWWAVENGIISGTRDGMLNPKGLATRAQVAAMLMRFLENVG